MARLITALAFLAVMAGCEADSTKLDRLQGDRSIALLGVMAAERHRDSIATYLVDSMIAAGALAEHVRDEDTEGKVIYLFDEQHGWPTQLDSATAALERERDKLLLADRELNRFTVGQ